MERPDVNTIISFSQAISGVLTSEQLLEMLLRAALQHAGATRALFVAAAADQKLLVKAEASVHDSGGVVGSQSAPTVPESVARPVFETRDMMVIGDASNEASLSNDPYCLAHSLRSICCLPLINKDNLVGALYLENDRRANVFTPVRVDLMRVLASLTTIALENSTLSREVVLRKAMIHRLVDANVIGVFLSTIDGIFLDANDEFLRMVGYDRQDLVAGRITRAVLSPPEFHERDMLTVKELKTVGVVAPFEKEYICKNGKRLPILIGFAVFDQDATWGVGFVVDLTDKKRSEAALRESEHRYHEAQIALTHANRLAIVGQLTASIAHEIKQPLSSAMMNAQAAVHWMEGEPQNLPEAKDSMRRVIQQTARTAAVVDRIRWLVKKSAPLKDFLQINEAILEVIALTRSESSKHDVRIRTDLTDGLPLIFADRVQMQQVVLNLILNAMEASTDTEESAREVVVTTGAIGTTEVAIAVSDSGPGLAPENLERIFEPFYTTKVNGLGLGLSICRSIVEAHDGQLSASNNTPCGATFRFTLPIGQEASAQ